MTVPGAVEAPDEIIELRPRMPLQHTLARWLATLKPEWYPSAATAYAGMSLTHRHLASSVAYLACPA